MKTVKVKRVLSEDEGNALGGTLLTPEAVDRIYKSTVKVIDQDTGQLLAVFIKKAVPERLYKDTYDSLVSAATDTDNRGMAAGWDESKVKNLIKREGAKGYIREEGSLRYRMITQDGSVSNTTRAVRVKSGIVGYMDRSSRFPYCRLTAFTEKQFDKFKSAYPTIKAVNELYKKFVPERYENQYKAILDTSEDFVIRDTVFTTVTVNLSFQTAVHKDAGDLKSGFGNLFVLEQGRYTGGYFCLPEWRIGFDVREGDCLFVDVHQWHGNTPIIGEGHRMSLVMYYREKMGECGTMEEELNNLNS